MPVAEASEAALCTPVVRDTAASSPELSIPTLQLADIRSIKMNRARRWSLLGLPGYRGAKVGAPRFKSRVMICTLTTVYVLIETTKIDLRKDMQRLAAHSHAALKDHLFSGSSCKMYANCADGTERLF